MKLFDPAKMPLWAIEVLSTKDKVQIVLAEKLRAQLTQNWDPYAQ